MNYKPNLKVKLYYQYKYAKDGWPNKDYALIMHHTD